MRVRVGFSHRAHIMGVRVKLTSSETMMANAMVRPKLCMKRPTIPLMNATGTKIATSDRVVASTASPISCRRLPPPPRPGAMPFSSMNR